MSDEQALPGKIVLTVRWDNHTENWLIHGSALGTLIGQDEGGMVAPGRFTLPQALEKAAEIIRNAYANERPPQ